MRRIAALLIGLGLAMAPVLVGALPHIPAGDTVIVETLPLRYDPALSALAGLRQRVQQQPRDLAASLSLARAYIEAARRDGDPRFLGYAQATLAVWPEGAGAAAGVRVLRATILQSLHQFGAALAELDAVLAMHADHAQALLTRATILQVTGRFAEAQRDCAALLRDGGEVSAALCLGGVASVTGRPSTARSLAQHALAGTPAGDTAARLWAFTVLAETANREGAFEQAATYFQQALQADASDRYARAAYCDFLLDRGEPGQVLAWTRDQTRDDNLLLRRALALQALTGAAAGGAARAAWQEQLNAAVAQLRERHAAAQQRGDRSHLREAARLSLFLLRDPGDALRLARENWAVQKEPADARILLEAAIAAHDAATRAQLTAWLRSSGLTDTRLAALLHS
ncbi:MAG TPA: hypothetical protein VF931_02415 [Steroidobacteraceae bacterium]